MATVGSNVTDVKGTEEFSNTQVSTCLCGTVEIEWDLSNNMGFNICHCEGCTKGNNNPASVILIPSPAMKYLKGEENMTMYESTPGVQRRPFCNTCGSRLYNQQLKLGIVACYPAMFKSLAKHAHVRLPERFGRAHTWYDNRVVDYDDGTPKFADFPPSFGGTGTMVDGKGNVLPPATPPQDKSILDAQKILSMDTKLQEAGFNLNTPFASGASEESVEKTRIALEQKGYTVQIVNTAEEALQAVIAAVPEGSSLYTTGSITLEQIGLIDFLKNNDGKYNNLKAKYLNAQYVLKDTKAAGELLSQGFTCDNWITSVSAITESGEILSADATGTRTAGLTTAKASVIVSGTNKIVADWQTAEKRLNDYSFALESARCREVYKAPGSVMSRIFALRAPGFVPPKMTFVLIRGAYGY